MNVESLIYTDAQFVRVFFDKSILSMTLVIERFYEEHATVNEKFNLLHSNIIQGYRSNTTFMWSGVRRRAY